MTKYQIYIWDFDGWNVFIIVGGERSRYLEFNSEEDAMSVAIHWNKWIRGEP